MFYGNAILPAGRINPADPYNSNEYGWTDGTIYLVARPGKSKPSLAIMSAGRTVHAEGWGESREWVPDAVGYAAEFYHDQTGAQKGRYVVVGIVDFDAACFDRPGFIIKSEGCDVPNKSLPMAVYK